MARLLPYSISWQDEHYIAVNKQSGIPVIPGRNSSRTSIRQLLEKYFNQPIIPLHRIDQETSGIVLFAKTAEAHKIMFETMGV